LLDLLDLSVLEPKHHSGQPGRAITANHHRPSQPRPLILVMTGNDNESRINTCDSADIHYTALQARRARKGTSAAKGPGWVSGDPIARTARSRSLGRKSHGGGRCFPAPAINQSTTPASRSAAPVIFATNRHMGPVAGPCQSSVRLSNLHPSDIYNRDTGWMLTIVGGKGRRRRRSTAWMARGSTGPAGLRVGVRKGKSKFPPTKPPTRCDNRHAYHKLPSYNDDDDDDDDDDKDNSVVMTASSSPIVPKESSGSFCATYRRMNHRYRYPIFMRAPPVHPSARHLRNHCKNCAPLPYRCRILLPPSST
jgi:hypothetical protein